MRKTTHLDRNLVWDVGVVSIPKNGESLCGDQCLWARSENGARIILSDGIGSGVKANILSTLTSTMFQTMLTGNIPLEECVSAVAATLPLRKDVQLAYATFTAAATTSTAPKPPAVCRSSATHNRTTSPTSPFTRLRSWVSG